MCLLCNIVCQNTKQPLLCLLFYYVPLLRLLYLTCYWECLQIFSFFSYYFKESQSCFPRFNECQVPWKVQELHKKSEEIWKSWFFSGLPLWDSCTYYGTGHGYGNYVEPAREPKGWTLISVWSALPVLSTHVLTQQNAFFEKLRTMVFC